MKKIIGLFINENNDPGGVSIGANALKITSIFYFFLGMIYVPRSILNGCGDTGFAMINGITEVVCRIGISPLLTKISSITIFGIIISIGFWGIWITTGLTWLFTSLICIIRYKRGRWQKNWVSIRSCIKMTH